MDVCANTVTILRNFFYTHTADYLENYHDLTPIIDAASAAAILKSGWDEFSARLGTEGLAELFRRLRQAYPGLERDFLNDLFERFLTNNARWIGEQEPALRREVGRIIV